MSKLGLMFAGAAGAVGSGVASLASRYLDEEMAMNKAQALAELQRSTAKAVREDDAEFSDKRAPVERARKRDDALAAGKTAREIELESLNDTSLEGAREGAKDRASAGDTRRKIDESKALTPAQIERENAVLDGTADAKAKAAGKAKRAEAENSAYDLAPGGQRFIGSERVASNNRATPQEVQRSLYEDGLKRSGGSGKADKMPEAEKLQYQELIKAAQAADAELSKFAGAGQPMTDKDGKASENFAYLQKQKVQAARRLIGFQMQKGLIDPGDAAMNAIAGEKDAGKIGQAIAEAFALGGSEFGDAFYDKVRKSGVLESLADDREAAASKAPAGRGGRADRAPPAAEMTPPDSPSGRHQARQASLMATEQGRRAQREQEAQAAFSSLDLRDPQKASELQQSSLFSFLTREQKAAVQRAVMGR